MNKGAILSQFAWKDIQVGHSDIALSNLSGPNPIDLGKQPLGEIYYFATTIRIESWHQPMVFPFYFLTQVLPLACSEKCANSGLEWWRKNSGDEWVFKDLVAGGEPLPLNTLTWFYKQKAV